MASLYEDNLSRPGKKKEYARQLADLTANPIQRPTALPSSLTQAGATAPTSVLDSTLSRRPQQSLAVPTLNPVAAAPAPVVQQAAPAAVATPAVTPAPTVTPILNASAAQVAADGQARFTRPQPSPAVAAAQASNVPGTAVINGKVVSPERIAALAGQPGGPASTGNYNTPPAAGLTRPQGPVNGFANPSEAARMTASELGAIATGDWRSAAGLAARNARVDATATPTRIGTTSKERQAIRQGNIDQANGAVGALTQQALQQPVLAAQQAAAQQREAGETERALISADAGVEQARITRPGQQRQNITLADGTLAQVGEDGLSRPVLGPDGKPVRQQAASSTVDQAARLKLLDANLVRTLGADPLSGKITDPATGELRQATGAELQAANAAALELTDAALNPTGRGAVQQGAVPSKVQFMEQARQQNPGKSDQELEAYYKANYGG